MKIDFSELAANHSAFETVSGDESDARSFPDVTDPGGQSFFRDAGEEFADVRFVSTRASNSPPWPLQRMATNFQREEDNLARRISAMAKRHDTVGLVGETLRVQDLSTEMEFGAKVLGKGVDAVRRLTEMS